MPLTIVRNDITKMEVDAIVNAANTALQMGGGVCGAIFEKAGAEKLQAACDRISPIKTGEAALTKGFGLPAKYVIHAAGPVYRGGKYDEEKLLYSCYINSLELAKTHKCGSVAFPLISSGIYGYPKSEALAVATKALKEWLLSNEMEVFLVVFDKASFELSKDLTDQVKSFIDKNYVAIKEKKHAARTQITEEYFADFPHSKVMQPETQAIAAEMFAEKLDEPFSETLLRLIDNKGKTDVEIYKRANIDRKLFSKIRTGKNYIPSKKTAVALAVALELSLAETRDLLERAGFALSRSMMFDVIIEYFITQKKYDIYEINNVLFEYDQPVLGG